MTAPSLDEYDSSVLLSLKYVALDCRTSTAPAIIWLTIKQLKGVPFEEVPSYAWGKRTQ